MKRPSSCIIVGAGISGLLAARTLQANSVKVTILEKSRGVGGRMATRRIRDSIADHGAQFLTADTEEFSLILNSWSARGLVEPWIESTPPPPEETAPESGIRYRAIPSMTAIPKELARDLDVRLGERVLRAQRSGDRWDLLTDQGLSFSGESLLLTPPVPQSLSLFESGRYPLSSEDLATLREVRYSPCIALLLVLDGPSAIPPPGCVQLQDTAVRWIADNRTKGISPSTVLTVHTSPDFSRQMLEAPDEDIYSRVRPVIRPVLGSEIIDAQIHRWRYAEPMSVLPVCGLLARSDPDLVFAGDAFGRPGIEGAALSGLEAAAILLRNH